MSARNILFGTLLLAALASVLVWAGINGTNLKSYPSLASIELSASEMAKITGGVYYQTRCGPAMNNCPDGCYGVSYQACNVHDVLYYCYYDYNNWIATCWEWEPGAGECKEWPRYEPFCVDDIFK